MVCGVGIDIAEMARFESFQRYSRERLLEIFSESELSQCEKEYTLLAPINQFYASRFAAKEAFYKALTHSLFLLGYTKRSFSFAFARKQVEVVKTTWDLPMLKVNWKALGDKIGAELPTFKAHLSISHEKTHAIAVVVLEKETS